MKTRYSHACTDPSLQLPDNTETEAPFDIAALLNDVDVTQMPAIHNSRNPLKPLRQALTLAEEISS